MSADTFVLNPVSDEATGAKEAFADAKMRLMRGKVVHDFAISMMTRDKVVHELAFSATTRDKDIHEFAPVKTRLERSVTDLSHSRNGA